jgi:hypothetical protein
MTQSKTKNNLVLTFNETTWELKSLGKEEKVIQREYPVQTETRTYYVYSVYLNGKNYKKTKVKFYDVPMTSGEMTNVHIYQNDEYRGNLYFKTSTVNLDEIVDIIKWVKFYGEHK